MNESITNKSPSTFGLLFGGVCLVSAVVLGLLTLGTCYIVNFEGLSTEQLTPYSTYGLFNLAMTVTLSWVGRWLLSSKRYGNGN